MTTYVLVGGAWLGGWCWQTVARRLRDDGHDAYPVTLTGLGERAHLASPEIDLDTHITDVVNLIEYEDLHDIVLLGHSYAGIVVTGVADRIRERISQLVYLDGGPTPDGLSFLDMQPPEARQYIERQVAEIGGGWRLPLPSWEELENVTGASLEGLNEPQRQLMRARAVAQPFGTYTQPLRLGNTASSGSSRKVFITNSFPLARVRESIAGGHPFGLGLGAVLQTYMLFVQNATTRQELGVATAVTQLSRSLGATFGTAIFGTVMSGGLARELPRHLPPGAAGAVLDPGTFTDLPPAVVTGIREALAAALHPVFLAGIPIIAAAFVAALFIRELPLRKTAYADEPSSEQAPYG